MDAPYTSLRFRPHVFFRSPALDEVHATIPTDQVASKAQCVLPRGARTSDGVPIKSNIAAFGGNPDNVTIFGQSAGSYSINYLMSSPVATPREDDLTPRSS